MTWCVVSEISLFHVTKACLLAPIHFAFIETWYKCMHSCLFTRKGQPPHFWYSSLCLSMQPFSPRPLRCLAVLYWDVWLRWTNIHDTPHQGNLSHPFGKSRLLFKGLIDGSWIAMLFRKAISLKSIAHLLQNAPIPEAALLLFMKHSILESLSSI